MVQSTLPFLISPDKTPKRRLDQTDKENQQHGSSLKKHKITKTSPTTDATTDNIKNKKDNQLGTPPNEPFSKNSNETAQEVISLDSPEKPKPVEPPEVISLDSPEKRKPVGTLPTESSHPDRISINESKVNTATPASITKDDVSSDINDSFTKDDSKDC
ncbi:unnamed protein product [Ambrosiozyma monospora]|uniref:Unnamed protein product n=1 Tax=Ambrosiozyma monospora TaxID=43982 RepID=A0ACB5U6C1_AMBMO|nr:unnamed protein product [Ambrosiozyma monospora]